MRQIIKKLNNISGTSLIETLVTLILVGLMGITIVAGISAIQSANDKIVRKSNEDVLLSTTLMEMKDWIRYSTEYDTASGRFHSNSGVWFKFRNANEDEYGIQIEIYQDKSSVTPAKTMPVVPKSNGDISKIYSSFDTITLEEGKYKITNLKVSRKGQEGTKLEECVITPIGIFN